MKVVDGVHTPSRIHFVSDPFGDAFQWLEMTLSGEAAVDQEDKIVVPPRKEPEVEKKKKPEHEHESEFGEEKESKERKEKALKEIEMGNAAYKATVLPDLLGEAAVDQEDKIVVPPRKEPEVEKKKNPEH
ncbi:hypothetical protein F2Q69_00054203 [Brassica cretica]|uniref:Uncharacterized protein n=1 Tax=Brassica cretica TaxID=69181 RepID=A0A8S9MTV9_BRACR|nr:hypothetical protein F2Q69_00054203 [Brassica cretica]